MQSKKVEFLARFQKKKTLSEDDKAFIEAQRIINPEAEIKIEDEIETEYDLLIIDLKDISDVIRYDEEHTQIIKYSNMLYVLKIPYDEFREIYSSTLGVLIYSTTTS
jgi:hypothetical protein